MERLVQIGVVLILVGFMLVFVAGLSKLKAGESKFVVVGLLGPIPFGFGNDKRLMVFAVALTVGLMALFWLLRR